MSLYLTSDNHFFHENIIMYCNRPFSSVEEMNEKMVKRWNKRVGKEDIVVHLGDFSLGKPGPTLDLIDELNGNIFLIKGNHDRRTRTFWELKAGFKRYFKRSIYISDNITLSHRPERVKGVINLHGHVHNNLSAYHSYGCVNLSVEIWDYYPVNLNNIKYLSKIDKENIFNFFNDLKPREY